MLVITRILPSSHFAPQLVSQLTDLLGGVKEAKASVEVKLGQQEKLREELMRRKQELVRQQQQYYALLNRIQELIRKNQTLSDKMEQIRS